MPRLESTLDLLRRHHSASGSASRRGGSPTSAAWHSLWPELEEIRQASASGDVESRDWLALNHNLIHAVEVCRGHDLKDALTFKPSR